MKKLFFILLISPLLFAAACVKTSTVTTMALPTPTPDLTYNHSLSVGNKTLSVQIVSTETEMAQGLSNRARMNEDQGMLFDFGKGISTSPSFWMKDMRFNLDFVWIKNNTVISITKNVPAPEAGTLDQNLKLYYPPSPVDKVLEVNEGWTDRNGIIIGDKVIEQE